MVGKIARLFAEAKRTEKRIETYKEGPLEIYRKIGLERHRKRGETTKTIAFSLT